MDTFKSSGVGDGGHKGLLLLQQLFPVADIKGHSFHTRVMRALQQDKNQSKAMAKTKEQQTPKERNTQRRKRKKGWFHKAYLLWKMCDFEVAGYVRNPESGQIYTFSSGDGVWFPPSMEDIVSAMPRPFPTGGMLMLRRS
jgi:hypothetical protein